MRTRLLLLLTLSLALLPVSAEDAPIKREVRGAWLATVYCIDWPTKTGTGTTIRNEQRTELRNYINILHNANLNAVYFQVRPMADALYKSSYEPWSSYVSGTRGKSPGWDPLQFAVEECHRCGMECHAWVNPYRWATTAAGWTTEQDLQLKEDGMLISYTNGNGATTIILNPALKATRDRITAVCREIITNYDVDGIIFDDYFYPSGMPTSSDAEDYSDYKNSKSRLSFADWRRENVNKMVADVYNMIQEVNPAIRFGISPAGAACTDATVAAKHGITKCPVASDWQYNGIFSDPVAWLKAGTIDYISPQLYWKTNHSTNPFEPLTKWWSYVAKHFKRHHYASHSLTFLQSSNTESDWVEVGEQLQYSRKHTENAAPGSIYYSACDIDGKKVKGFGTWLKKNKYQYPALTPAIDWKDAYPCERVRNLVLGVNKLSWDSQKGMRYTIYAIPEDVTDEQALSDKAADGLNATYLVATTYTNSYSIPAAYRKGFHYAVCTLDRYGNESAPRFTDMDYPPAAEVPQLVWPDDEATFKPSVCLKWTEGNADGYTLEVSRNKGFTSLILTASSGWNAENGMIVLDTDDSLWKEATYYWRVKASAAGCEDVYSEIRSFTISRKADTDGTNIDEMADAEPTTMTVHGREVEFSRTVEAVRVLNVQGIIVAERRNVDSFRLDNLPRGIYIVKARSGKDIIVNKIKI
ncbi:MAG: family 10 glycosylhydrolase [Bacteroidaceae bacterium]|nr:family 10 glycosylhydrolase [Bacteroidaceae bacterium]